MRERVLCSGISCITDLMVKEGLVNLDFPNVRAIMSEMGTAMIGAGEAAGDRRAHRAAEAAIANSLFDDASLKGARGVLISITGGSDLTLYEVDEAASRLCHVNLNWPREVSTTQFEFMRLSQLATSGKLLLGRCGACGGM
jgi:cell division protein FtsZ